jgi:hypothetical protein
MEKNLSEFVDYEGDPEVLLDWDNFTNPVRNILKRLFFAKLDEALYERISTGCCYSFLKDVSYFELLDMRQVGDLRREQVITELKNVFNVFEEKGLDGWVVPVIDYQKQIEEEEANYQPDAIDLAINLEELVNGILREFNDYREINDRVLGILRGRVPAFLHQEETLEEIGNRFGITRERVRQIEVKFKDLQLGFAKESNFCLHALVEVLEESKSEGEFIELAKDKDLLGAEPISVEKLKGLITIVGIQEYLDRVEAVESEWEAQESAFENVTALAKKLRHKFGLIDLTTFTAEANTDENSAFKAIQDGYPRSVRAGKLVLARTNKLDSGFENAIGKQLLVFKELSAESLLVGIDRQAQYRQAPLVGQTADQIALIKLIAGNEPNYETFCKNTLEEPELSDTDLWFVDILRNSPANMLHRNELTAAALRDNRNVNSVGIFLLFNPLIRSLGSAVIALADAEISTEDARSYAEIIRAAEEPTQLDFTFVGSDLLIQFTPNLNTIAAGVLFPKQELRDLIKDLSIDVQCECENFESKQQLRHREPSFWTGFTAAIKHLRNQHSWREGEDVRMLIKFEDSLAKILLDS